MPGILARREISQAVEASRPLTVWSADSVWRVCDVFKTDNLSTIPVTREEMPLTVAEIKAHPAYGHLDWKLPPTDAGHCEVARGRRGGPFKVYYEVHGRGPTRILVCPASPVS